MRGVAKLGGGAGRIAQRRISAGGYWGYVLWCEGVDRLGPGIGRVRDLWLVVGGFGGRGAGCGGGVLAFCRFCDDLW